MFSFELDFFPRTEARGDEHGQFDDVLLMFFIHLEKNGNILFKCERCRLVSMEAVGEPTPGGELHP